MESYLKQSLFHVSILLRDFVYFNLINIHGLIAYFGMHMHLYTFLIRPSAYLGMLMHILILLKYTQEYLNNLNTWHSYGFF